MERGVPGNMISKIKTPGAGKKIEKYTPETANTGLYNDEDEVQVELTKKKKKRTQSEDAEETVPIKKKKKKVVVESESD